LLVPAKQIPTVVYARSPWSGDAATTCDNVEPSTVAAATALNTRIARSTL
jgi:hypothetical protein